VVVEVVVLEQEVAAAAAVGEVQVKLLIVRHLLGETFACVNFFVLAV
jgi:hypothetical protein